MDVKFYKPSTKFADLEYSPRPGQKSILPGLLMSMDEDQLRWTLWCLVVGLLGNMSCNAAETLINLKPKKHMRYMWESLALAIELSTGGPDTEAAVGFREEMYTVFPELRPNDAQTSN